MRVRILGFAAVASLASATVPALAAETGGEPARAVPAEAPGDENLFVSKAYTEALSKTARESARRAEAVASDAKADAFEAREAALHARRIASESRTASDDARSAAREAREAARGTHAAAAAAAASASETKDAAVRTATSAEQEAAVLTSSQRWLSTFSAITSAELAALQAIQAAAERRDARGSPADSPGAPTPTSSASTSAASSARLYAAPATHDAATAAPGAGDGELAGVASLLGDISNRKAFCIEQIAATVADIELTDAMRTHWNAVARRASSSRSRDAASEKVVQLNAAAAKLRARKVALEADHRDLERSELDAELRREYVITVIGAGRFVLSSFAVPAWVLLAIVLLLAARTLGIMDLFGGAAPRTMLHTIYTAMPFALVCAIAYSFIAIAWNLAAAMDHMNTAFATTTKAWAELWRSQSYPGHAPQLLCPDEAIKDLLASQTWKSALASVPFAGIAALIQKLGTRPPPESKRDDSDPRDAQPALDT